MATDVEALLLRIEASATKLEKDMARANSIFDRGARRMETQAKVVGARIGGALGRQLMSSVSGFTVKAGAAFAAVFSAEKLFNASQAFVRLSNQLKVAGLSGDALKSTYDELFKVAQANGAPIETLVGLYSKAAQAQDNLGASNEQLLAFSTAVAEALRVQGKGAEESAGALTQLGQVISGNVVQAEEYNSLIDGAYPLLQAAAAGIKEAGGSVATLTQLVKQGKVASKAFFDGILAGAPVLSDKLAGAEDTAATAGTRFYNSLINVAGKIDEAVGLSSALTSGINDISSVLDNNADDWAAWAGSVKQSIVDALGAWQTYMAEAAKAPPAAYNAYGTGVPSAGYNPYAKPAATADTKETIPGYTTGGGFGGEPNNAGAGYEALNAYYKKHPITIPAEVKPVSIKDYKVTSNKSGGGSGGGGSRENAYERELKQTKERTADLQATIPLIGKEAWEIDQARIAQDLKNAATEAGLKLTPERLAEIESVSAAYGEQAKIYDELKRKQDDMQEAADRAKDATRDSIKGLVSDLIHGRDASEALSDALSSLGDTLLDIGLNYLLTGSANGQGKGGFLGSLFNLLPGFDGGGYTGPGGKYTPRGVVHAGEFVFDRDSVRAAGGPQVLDAMRKGLKGYANGGYVSTSAPSLSSIGMARSQPTDIRVRVDNDGNLQAFVERTSRTQVRAAAPQIVSTSVKMSSARVVPTMAAYQAQRAGGDYRNV